MIRPTREVGERTRTRTRTSAASQRIPRLETFVSAQGRCPLHSAPPPRWVKWRGMSGDEQKSTNGRSDADLGLMQ